MSFLNTFFTCFLLVLLTACKSKETPPNNLKGEYIYRQHDEFLFKIDPPQLSQKPPYPWESNSKGQFSKITKEYFRCKGSLLNPARTEQKEKETLRFYDCAGTQKHSLPLCNGKEFIYPILIDLLNYIQDKSGKKVVITCGHCCPDHNLYIDPSPKNQTSKHLIGAEVDFYVQGMETETSKIIQLIQNYYKDNPKYKDQKEYLEFKRYEKNDTDVSTQPWYNKEIFVKAYKKEEGRNFDNRHPYPYLSIQVRHDFNLNEKVIYSWDKAFHNFQRW